MLRHIPALTPSAFQRADTFFNPFFLFFLLDENTLSSAVCWSAVAFLRLRRVSIPLNLIDLLRRSGDGIFIRDIWLEFVGIGCCRNIGLQFARPGIVGCEGAVAIGPAGLAAAAASGVGAALFGSPGAASECGTASLAGASP